jgi:hypothetical protein
MDRKNGIVDRVVVGVAAVDAAAALLLFLFFVLCESVSVLCE